jgi:hypothetical protein
MDDNNGDKDDMNITRLARAGTKEEENVSLGRRETVAIFKFRSSVWLARTAHSPSVNTYWTVTPTRF